MKQLRINLDATLMRKFLVFVLLIIVSNFVFMHSGMAQALNIYCEADSQIKRPDGSFSGMDIEIVAEIQKRVRNTDPIQVVPFTRGLKYLDNDPNTLLFSMARTKERNALYQWVGPVAEAVYGFYAKADSPIVINSLEDAKKVESIGVYRNDIRDRFLTEQGFTNLDRADNNFLNLRKLMAGRDVVMASSSFGIKVEAKRAGYNVNDVKFLYAFLHSQIYIAVSKNTDPKIVGDWNAALESMKKDGTLKAIFKKYSPGQELPGPEITIF
jgi:polar amino acid transport system substrate-binding protein